MVLRVQSRRLLRIAGKERQRREHSLHRIVKNCHQPTGTGDVKAAMAVADALPNAAIERRIGDPASLAIGL